MDLAATDGRIAEILLGLDPETRPTQDDFVGLLQAASDGEGLLEARSGGQSQVTGVTAQAYTFVIDLGPLADNWPPFLESLLGGGGAGPPPGELLDSLSPLPAEMTLHVDGDHLVRQLQLDLDLGAILMTVFAGFGDVGEIPEGAVSELPDIEYLFPIRFETVALNDPALAVAPRDPSRIVDLP